MYENLINRHQDRDRADLARRRESRIAETMRRAYEAAHRSDTSWHMVESYLANKRSEAHRYTPDEMDDSRRIEKWPVYVVVDRDMRPLGTLRIERMYGNMLRLAVVPPLSVVPSYDDICAPAPLDTLTFTLTDPVRYDPLMTAVRGFHKQRQVLQVDDHTHLHLLDNFRDMEGRLTSDSMYEDRDVRDRLTEMRA